MHILLTDVLTCPRCGPEFGLILMADAMDARRVRSGSLGCANCRERYAIAQGVADLRPRTLAADGEAPAEEGAATPVPAQGPDEDGAGGRDDAALRLAALLDLTEGGGVVLLAGAPAGLAPALARHLAHGEVAADATGLDVAAEGVSRLALPLHRLPFAARSLRGAALAGGAAARLLEEAARAIAPMRRLVLEGAPPDAGARLERAGLEVLAREGGTIVALKRDRPDPPKLYQLV